MSLCPLNLLLSLKSIIIKETKWNKKFRRWLVFSAVRASIERKGLRFDSRSRARASVAGSPALVGVRAGGWQRPCGLTCKKTPFVHVPFSVWCCEKFREKAGNPLSLLYRIEVSRAEPLLAGVGTEEAAVGPRGPGRAAVCGRRDPESCSICCLCSPLAGKRFLPEATWRGQRGARSWLSREAGLDVLRSSDACAPGPVQVCGDVRGSRCA